MVSGTELAVIGTLAGSVVGATITGLTSRYNTRIQQEGQNERQRAEFYLDKKVEYLTSLYDALLQCDYLIRGTSSVWDEERWREYHEERAESEVQEVLEELETAVGHTSVFLSEEDARIIRGTLFRATGLFQELGRGKPGILSSDFIWEKYEDSMNEAKRILREELDSPAIAG